MMKISTKSQSHRAYGFKEILFNYFFFYFLCFLVSTANNENKQWHKII